MKKSMALISIILLASVVLAGCTKSESNAANTANSGNSSIDNASNSAQENAANDLISNPDQPSAIDGTDLSDPNQGITESDLDNIQTE